MSKIGKSGIIKKWWLTPFFFMKAEKEIINIELGESSSIDVSVGIGTNRAEVIEEIKKGVYRAFAFFDSLKDIKFEINFIYSREEFDKYLGEKTENWVIAHSFGNKFIIFAPEEIEKLTSHKRNEFQQIVCHETCHILLQKINPKFSFWMFEGIALNVSSQIKRGDVKKENIEYFINECLFKNTGYVDFISHQGYLISYLLMKFLLDNYSKEIIMDLLKIRYESKNLAEEELCKILSKTKEEVVNSAKNILGNKTA